MFSYSYKIKNAFYQHLKLDKDTRDLIKFFNAVKDNAPIEIENTYKKKKEKPKDEI